MICLVVYKFFSTMNNTQEEITNDMCKTHTGRIERGKLFNQVHLTFKVPTLKYTQLAFKYQLKCTKTHKTQFRINYMDT